ncbi:hypothetical protein GCM10027596_21350 [Nocardioides korecus]
MAERHGPTGRRGRLLAAGAVGLALLGAALPAAAPAGAATARDGGSRATAPHARTWQGDAMRLDRVHRTATGKGVVIALLDGGIAPDVPALKGAHIEMRKSPCSAQAKHPVPVFEKGPSSEHGSLMASLLVGGGNGFGGPGTGLMGVAPDATLRFYDIDELEFSKPGALECPGEDIVATARQAIRDGADVVSLSFGTPTDLDSEAWTRLARTSSAVLVAAPINKDDRPRSFAPPAGAPGIVSVNALDQKYFPWKKSVSLRDTSGRGVQAGWWTPTVSAPGVHLDLPGAAEGFGAGAWATGTSGATALVAGAVALEKQEYPRATANQLIQNLIHHTTRESITGSRKLPDMTWALETGFGAVSVVNMLKHDPAGWPDVNPLTIDPTKMAATYPSSIYGKGSSSASGSASASPSAAASTGSGAQAAQAGKASSGTTADQGGGVPGWVWVVVALVLLLVAGIVATAASRRRRATPPTARPGGPGPSGTDEHLTRAGGQ